MFRRSINLGAKRFLQSQKSWISANSSEKNVPHTVSKSTNQQKKSFTDTQNRLLEEQNQKLYFMKDDPNIFGNLSTATKDLVQKNHLEDEGDIREANLLSNPVSHSKKLSMKQYADIIKSYLRKRQIKEAIDVLEVKMLQEDKMKPDNYIYNLILGGCGRVGYTKKAFKLFNDMKKRGLDPTNGTYTALFNACSNSPWIEDGLTRAKNLRELMKEKGVIANDTNYNAMIKAFGRCGDIKTAFSLVDGMIENNIFIKGDTLNFLLQSCVSDKDSGFRHALLVWRKFHQRNIKPDIYSFNTLLRCVRDCNMGDVEIMNNLLQSPEFKTISCNKNNSNNVLSLNESKSSFQEDNESNVIDLKYNRPNLIAPTPYLGNIVKLNEVSKPEDRLVLIGGLSGFLDNLKEFKVRPDAKTFSQLLDCIPSTLAAENALLSAMKKEGVKYDVDFLNMLIKKRSMRFDYENARDVVATLFKPPKIRPDLITYGVLALSCVTKEQAEDLIQEMKDAGYRMNIEILGAMLKQACIRMNFIYVLELMEIVVKENIKPNKIFMQNLEELHKRSKLESRKKKDKSFFRDFGSFRLRYGMWRKEIEMDASEDVHPWDQFRKSTETNVKNYKDPAVHFKPRISSRFRQKTGTRSQ